MKRAVAARREAPPQHDNLTNASSEAAMDVRMRVLEKDIQDWVVERVQQGDLGKHIQGAERVQLILKSAQETYFIPTFPIDYLLRRRAAEAAHGADPLGRPPCGASCLASPYLMPTAPRWLAH